MAAISQQIRGFLEVDLDVEGYAVTAGLDEYVGLSGSLAHPDARAGAMTDHNAVKTGDRNPDRPPARIKPIVPIRLRYVGPYVRTDLLLIAGGFRTHRLIGASWRSRQTSDAGGGEKQEAWAGQFEHGSSLHGRNGEIVALAYGWRKAGVCANRNPARPQGP
jgi:hypothetical protein